MKTIKYFCLTLALICSQTILAQSTETILVSGACGMCQNTIEQTANKHPGVKKADYDLDTKVLTVEVKTDDFDLKSLGIAIAKKGYDNEYATTDANTYNNLPGCCQYRELGGKYDDIQIMEDFVPSRFIKGLILDADEDGNHIPLIGATIRWEGKGSGAVTDFNGNFEIGRIDGVDNLEISYVGYDAVTIDVSQTNEVHYVMNSNTVFDEVVIRDRNATTEISFVKPIQTLVVSEEELCKAACCSLSESFETSPAIDVSFTDAITGTRQIQMLGLAGKYVQISRELLPDVRSLASIHGMSLTPGPWIESIQLSKGTGSVANGFESMTGQINIELRKPQKKDKLFLNLYGNQGSRVEGNLFYREKLTDKLSTGIILHGSHINQRHDRNGDGFLDMPVGDNFFILNRWQYLNPNGLQGQIGVKYSTQNKTGGQQAFFYQDNHAQQGLWGSNVNLEKTEIWTKFGKVLNESKNRSFGIQLQYSHFDDLKFFTNKTYNATHNNYFGNFLFQTDIGSSVHNIKSGLSFLGDVIDETVVINKATRVYARNELIPGAFAEYTFKPSLDVTVVAGLRGDYHNSYGFILTPRLHARYAINDETVIRVTGGSGWRTANIFAETPSLFVNNRNFEIRGNPGSSNPYGLNPEQSWNVGGNVTRTLYFGQRKGTLSLDYYYTWFENQIIPDFESSLDGTIIFANQLGESFGHSAQAQFDVELINNLDVRVAYRFNQSKAIFGDSERITPLNPPHKAFINLAYEAPRQWYFDFTLNWRSDQRLPDTQWLPSNLRLGDYAPAFYMANAQVRKFVSEEMEFYLGSENLLDYRQLNPIINAQDPSSAYFDGSYVYAPIFGRIVYVGLRYKLQE